MLCCIFNYAPLYRQAVYTAIDREFDAQFCFADEIVFGGGDCGIAKMDTSALRRPVIGIRNRMLFGRHPWRGGILRLALRRRYSTFLITGDLNWAYIPFLILCSLTGKRVYGWGHGIKSMEGFGGTMRRFARWFYGRLDGYFIYGSRGRDRMAELGFDPGKLHVIYNSLLYGLDTQGNAALESDVFRKHFGNGDPVLIFSGRLTEAKRADMLVEAMTRLNADGVRCNLIIIGEGPERARLEAMLRAEAPAGEIDPARGIVSGEDGIGADATLGEGESMSGGIAGRVWFYGECYDAARTAELLYNADLCVSPGNVGLMAIHAMQCGTPVVSHSNFETQMPEYETIIEDDPASDADSFGNTAAGAIDAQTSGAAESNATGALFREGDTEDLCRVISQWLSRHSGDRDRIRRNCYGVISEHWTAASQMATLLSVLGRHINEIGN